MADKTGNTTPDAGGAKTETRAGNYFVSNYPPFSFWSGEQVPRVHQVLESAPAPDAGFGLYVHIPFCRKRCDFCYFKVYTDKNSKEIRRYLDAVLKELRRYAELPYTRGRMPRFVYFGGGTPSYLSERQLRALFEGMQEIFPWDRVEEVTFECEPGTLQEAKITELKSLGVTRLSLGVENFDAEILELNNRAHRAKEIHRTYALARQAGFPQINIDLIAGMVGETDENWSACIDRTLELQPDCITIYQMEVPFNTTIYRRMKDDRMEVAPVADWETKRRWAAEAFGRLEADGYDISSAYTAYKGKQTRFLYRDALWTGADMLGVGVSSFSHLGGVHFQNEHSFEPYVRRVEADELPVIRALELDDEEKLIREFVLQMKLGRLAPSYFSEKFGVDVLSRFDGPLQKHVDDGYLSVNPEEIRASREGLMRIDQLLHDFFLEKHQNARYA